MLEKMRNQVYDTDYTQVIKQWGSPVVDWKKMAPADTRGWFDRCIDFFLQIHRPEKVVSEQSTYTSIQGKSLDEQLRAILALPDEQYDENMLTPELRRHIVDMEKEYVSTLQDYKSHIAPSYREVQSGQFSLSGILGKTYYATSYPSYIDFLRTREMLNYYAKRDMSWFVYPAEDTTILSMLKRRSTQLKAEISTAVQKGITYDTEIDIEHRDVEDIRQKLATREERYFETSFYTTIYEHDQEKLREESKKFEQKIGGYGVRMKQTTQRMDEGQVSTMPLCIDDLNIPRSMVSTSLGGSFPFISNDLIENSGILYGLNLHTGSLVIFDRFANRLPNANSIILATSGAWKSFSVKLEILRYLLLGIEVIVIDPENEYKTLTDKVGGSYINISINSQNHINPIWSATQSRRCRIRQGRPPQITNSQSY
jgi:conjugal transfer ATP-binding protein TraC